MPDVSVILPTYNEAETISELIDGVFKAVPENSEVIVVDDNSPDMTWKIAGKKADKDLRIRVLRRFERGLTSAISEGIQMAGAEIIVWMDADLSMKPALIPGLVSHLKSYDIVIGSRYAPGGGDLRSRGRVFCSRFLNLTAARLLHLPVKDLTTGFVAAKKKVFQKAKLSGNYGEYCIKFLCEAYRAGFKLKAVPYIFVDRTKGSSKTGRDPVTFFCLGLKYIRAVLHLLCTR